MLFCNDFFFRNNDPKKKKKKKTFGIILRIIDLRQSYQCELELSITNCEIDELVNFY